MNRFTGQRRPCSRQRWPVCHQSPRKRRGWNALGYIWPTAQFVRFRTRRRGGMSEDADRDVIAEVVKDHQEIKAMFAQVESASGQEKREAFESLARKLAVHETAE